MQECFNDAAVGHTPFAIAGGSNTTKFGYEAVQIRDLRFNLFNVLLGDGTDLRAGGFVLRCETKEFPYLIDGKSQVAAPPNEVQTAKVLFCVASIVSGRPCRFRHQPDLLVIADGHDL